MDLEINALVQLKPELLAYCIDRDNAGDLGNSDRLFFYHSNGTMRRDIVSAKGIGVLTYMNDDKTYCVVTLNGTTWKFSGHEVLPYNHLNVLGNFPKKKDGE
jgi:hypothetical protein